MRTYIGGQEALNAAEFEELAYGVDDFPDLFLGRPNETDEERAARTEVAREVLTELLAESQADEIAFLNALYAAQLASLAPLRNKVSARCADRLWKAA